MLYDNQIQFVEGGAESPANSDECGVPSDFPLNLNRKCPVTPTVKLARLSSSQHNSVPIRDGAQSCASSLTVLASACGCFSLSLCLRWPAGVIHSFLSVCSALCSSAVTFEKAAGTVLCPWAEEHCRGTVNVVADSEWLPARCFQAHSTHTASEWSYVIMCLQNAVLTDLLSNRISQHTCLLFLPQNLCQ